MFDVFPTFGRLLVDKMIWKLITEFDDIFREYLSKYKEEMNKFGGDLNMDADPGFF